MTPEGHRVELRRHLPVSVWLRAPRSGRTLSPCWSRTGRRSLGPDWPETHTKLGDPTMCMPGFGPWDTRVTWSGCGTPSVFVVLVSFVLALDGEGEPQETKRGARASTANRHKLRCRKIAAPMPKSYLRMPAVGAPAPAPVRRDGETIGSLGNDDGSNCDLAYRVG